MAEDPTSASTHLVKGRLGLIVKAVRHGRPTAPVIYDFWSKTVTEMLFHHQGEYHSLPHLISMCDEQWCLHVIITTRGLYDRCERQPWYHKLIYERHPHLGVMTDETQL